MFMVVYLPTFIYIYIHMYHNQLHTCIAKRTMPCTPHFPIVSNLHHQNLLISGHCCQLLHNLTQMVTFLRTKHHQISHHKPNPATILTSISDSWLNFKLSMAGQLFHIYPWIATKSIWIAGPPIKMLSVASWVKWIGGEKLESLYVSVRANCWGW